MKKITSICLAFICLATTAISASAYSDTMAVGVETEMIDISEQVIGIETFRIEENEEIKAFISDGDFQAVLIGDISDIQNIELSYSKDEPEVSKDEIGLLLDDCSGGEIISVGRHVILSSSDEQTVTDEQSNNYAEAYSKITYKIKDSNIFGDLKYVSGFSGNWKTLNNSASISKMSAEWYFEGKAKYIATVTNYSFSHPGSSMGGRSTLHASSEATITYSGKSYRLVTSIVV